MIAPEQLTDREGRPLWMHLCGWIDSWHHVKAFERPPYHGGCDHCASGYPKPTDWQPLYAPPKETT